MGRVVSIQVSVTLFGALREAAGGSELVLELADDATVLDALLACGLPDRVDIWALVDGQRTGRQARLRDGAQLGLFEPVGGG